MGAKYIQTAKTFAVALAVNTARNGSGTAPVILASAVGMTDGLRIEALNFQASGTTAAGCIRLYLHNGSTLFLFREIPTSGLTPAATGASESVQLTFGPTTPLILEAGWSLRATVHNTETWIASMFCGGQLG